MKSDLIENRQIRIFISSTFQDMKDERDYLVQTVFPSLRTYCADRDVTIQELDLRWGITQEQSERGEVVDICLKEIKNTMPFFIGLLGERYGWVPEPEQQRDITNNTSVFKEYPWIQEELEKNNTSITEIEIQDGVLRSQKKVNAYFYFRSVKMEVPNTVVYKEEPGGLKAKKLQSLKRTLHEQKIYPVADYDSPEHLGHLVERDFKELVDALFPKGAFSPLKKERLEQAAFLKSKTVIYEPVLGAEAKLNEFAESAGQCLVVTGESGSGKSALIANWIKKRAARDGEKLLYHFVGQSGTEGDYRKICARLISELRTLFSIYDDKTGAVTIQRQSIDEEQKSELQNLFVAVQARGRLIIILDGVDKFTDTNAKLFNWLPEFPANVKIIFSATENDPSMEYFISMNYSIVRMPPLEFETRKKLIANYLSFFGKNLTEAQTERIAGDKESENPLALCTLLEELRIFGEYGEKGEKLDAEIDRYLKPDNITGMFVLVLERLEKAFSRDFVETVLSVLFISRSGLSEAELLLLPGVVPLYWAQLSNSMANYLNVHGGKITFAQNYIMDAVKKCYLGDDAAINEYRKRLIEFIKGAKIPEFRKYEEIPYQLLELADWDGLFNFLLDFNNFNYLSAGLETIDALDLVRHRFELVRYWKPLLDMDRAKYTLENYLKCDTQGRTKVEMGSLYTELSAFAGLVSDFSAAYTFGKKAVAIMEEIYGTNRPETAAAYQSLGNAAGTSGRPDEMLDWHLKALAIYKAFGEENPGTALGYLLTGAAYLQNDSGEKAIEFILKAIAVQEKILGPGSPQIAVSYSLLAMSLSMVDDTEKTLEYALKAANAIEKSVDKNNSGMGFIYSALSNAYLESEDYEKAVDYAERSLSINRNIFGENSLYTGTSYQTLGMVYAGELEGRSENEKQETFKMFLNCMQKAIDIFSCVYGEKNKLAAPVLMLIAKGYSEIDDEDNAIYYARRGYSMYEEVFGKDDSHTANAGNALAMLYYFKGLSCKTEEDHKGAIENFSEAIRLDPNKADYFNGRAAAYMKIWDMDKSIADSDEALRLSTTAKPE